MEGGTLPDAVARAILRVAEDGAPRLHNPVGEDAEVLLAGRDRLPADEWVDLQAEPDEERFLAGAERVFGENMYVTPSLHSRRQGARAGLATE
jgi:hypothetical protein